MSITKKLIVTLQDGVATPSEKIYIYRGDIGIDIIIELENFDYKIDCISKKNMIRRVEAFFKTPDGSIRKYNDKVSILNGDKIKFSFNKAVIGDMQTIGQYELQFHLFDKADNRVTLPTYYFHVKRPIHDMGFEDEVDIENGIIGYAKAGYGKVQEEEIELFEINEDGYVKTYWQTGDLITASKLNKIENQLEELTNRKSGGITIEELDAYIEENKESLKGDRGDKGDDGLTTSVSVNGTVYLHSDGIIALPDYPTVPTKVSELTNDSNFATELYVRDKINEASLSGGEVDLSDYATKSELSNKVDKENGKGLSSNDYTTEDKNKLKAIEEGANKYIHPTSHSANMITTDSTHRFVTDSEKATWNNKSDFSGSYNDLLNKPNIPTKVSELTNDSNFATESYVGNKIAEASLSGGGNVDLSGYATKSELSNKVDKEDGKGLSSNDYTTIDKNKLGTIEEGANKYTHPTSHSADMITTDSTHRFVTDEEKTTWNSKSNFSGSYNDLTNKPSIPTKVSELLNDNEFTTPSEVSSLISEAIEDKVTKSELSGEVSTINEALKGKSNEGHTHSFDNLINKPIIPTKISELTNDSSYATESYVVNKIAEASLSGDGDIDLSGYATKDELFAKVDKVVGKGLSTNDFTDDLKNNYDTAYTHSQSAHAPSNAQKNSDITKTEIETKLTGNITTHTHNQYLTSHQDISGLATKSELDDKVDKISGMGLSSNDYTSSEKAKLETIEEGANNYTHPKTHSASIITPDSTHRFVTDEEKTAWNNKSDFSGSYNDLTDKPSIPTVSNDLTNELKAKYDTAYTHSQSTHVQLGDIPTKVSDLTNDSNFLTSIPSEYVTDTELNAKGYLTQHQDISGKANVSDLTSHTEDTDIHVTASEKTNWNSKTSLKLGTTSSTAYRGDYGNTAYTHSQSAHAPSDAQKNSDITKTEIETKLTGDITTHTHSQYLTEHQSLEGYAKTSDLHSHSNKTVLDGITSTNTTNWSTAYSHSTSAHAPSNAEANVQSDWNVADSSSDAYIKNKPTIPTKVSDLTNDSNFLTSIPSEYVTDTELNGKGYAKTSDIPTSLPANGGNADTVGGYTIWVGTQSQYDAIATKSDTTIYMIKEG